MKVLILVGLAFLSVIQLYGAVEFNSEAIEDGRYGTNRLKRGVNVGNGHAGGISANCNGSGNCNNGRKKREVNIGNGHAGGISMNCNGSGNCNNGRKKRRVNVANDNRNGMSVTCNGPNCNRGQGVSHPSDDPYQRNSHGDHQVDVANGNYETVQLNCNGVGRCNSGSESNPAPTMRNCVYQNGYIYENRTSRRMTYAEIDELNEYKQQINAYINRIDQIVKQYSKDLVEKIFTEHVTMAPLPAVPNPPCFCRNC